MTVVEQSGRVLLLRVLLLAPLLLSACSVPLETRLRGIVEQHETPGGPGGSVLVLRGDSVLFEHSFGLRRAGSSDPNTPSSNYRLASITKQFTAACILMLQERGRLRPDQTLRDFFPEFSPVGDSVTIHQLLCHTSGLVAYEDMMDDSTTTQVLDEDVLHMVGGIDSTYFPPGSQYRYSNTGYALLALIVQKASGKRFADFLREEIFEPCGMDGSLAFEDGSSEVPERTYGHARKEHDGQYVLADQSWTSAVLGDGGIYSSVRDLARWNRELEAPTIMRRETLEKALSEQVVSEDGKTRYGYGWYLGEMEGEPIQYHTGSTIGFRNAFFRVPGRRIAVIVLMNRDDGPAQPIARELLEAVLSDE